MPRGPLLRRSRLAAPSAIALSLALFSGPRVSPPEARAEAAACSLKGSPVLAKTTQAFGAAQGGDAIAKFTGQPVSMTLTLPTTAGARAQLKSSAGGFRLEGFLDASEVPAFSARNVAVVPEHVWIGGARRVKIVGASAGQVTLEMAAASPIDQTLKATSGCDAVSLEFPSFKQQAIPGTARGYLTKKSPLELRAEAGGKAVFTFSSSSVKDTLLFWSTDRTQSAVHVHLNGDVVVDGWVSAGDLEALKEGEIMDALGQGTPTVGSAKMSMAGNPTVIKAPREVTVRSKASDSAQVIGAVESGGEVVVLETVMGFSNVVPTSLHVMPPDGGGFWVKSSELK